MKIATVEHEGQPIIAVAVDEGLVDATGWLEGERDLIEVLRSDQLSHLRDLISARPDLDYADARFLPPVLNPRRMICVGVNYDDHRQETGRAKSEHPTLFVRWPSSVVGHEQAILRPPESARFDYEGELAVIIGKGGRRIPRSQALDHVAGYACFHDGSIRDFQRHTSQFTPGKNFERSGGFGPWMVTADEIPDPSSLELTTRVDGEVVQNAQTSDLIFDVPDLIAYITTFTPLEPGDVIATGTPGGVGDKRDPPLYLREGSTLEVEISRIGRLRHRVEDEEL